jgi:ubiquinone biosynthesis protein COQ4
MSELDLLSRRLREADAARHRAQWRRAWRALRALLADPDTTAHAYEVAYALEGDVVRRRLARFVAHPQGRGLLFARPSLREAVCDPAALARLREDSLGRAYLAHMRHNGFDPTRLPELRRASDPVKARDEVSEWFLERMDLTHDLRHVLTGYGADGAGEASLLTFTLAQRGGRATALLCLGAALRVWPRVGRGWPRYLWRAWWRGRRAAPLDLLPYESLLPLPLEDVRRAVGIEPPEAAHPEGVVASPVETEAA